MRGTSKLVTILITPCLAALALTAAPAAQAATADQLMTMRDGALVEQLRLAGRATPSVAALTGLPGMNS